MVKKPLIVISGINLNEGGTLSIMRDCLKYASLNLVDNYTIIALVHKKELCKDIKNIEYIEFEDSKKSYLKRVYYEYFYFKKLSKKLNPYLWFSIHDITPNVEAKIRAVYCHNPSPFYKMTKIEKKLEPKLRFFNLFYSFLYRINIRKNNFVIVQQRWLKEEFKRRYKVENLIVSYPNIDLSSMNYKKLKHKKQKFTFFYPSVPRVFKNFEIICEVAKIFEEKGKNDIEFILTIGSKLNKYDEYIYNKYKNIKSIKFVGKLTREEVFSYYDYSDVLIFPSKLETWGLPISEFKEFNKPILVSDLPYAKETIGNYEQVNFFNPYSVKELEEKINNILNLKKMEGNKIKIKGVEIGWRSLFEEILKRKNF